MYILQCKLSFLFVGVKMKNKIHIKFLIKSVL